MSVGIFPAVFLVGTLYRFPVPWRGYVSGWEMFQEGPDETMELVWMLVQAVVYYTLCGGFVALAALGVVAGFLGGRWEGPIAAIGMRGTSPSAWASSRRLSCPSWIRSSDPGWIG